MLSVLHFCRDGILRRDMSTWNPVEEIRTSKLVPLQAYERSVDKDAFLKGLHSVIVFEDGLTVADLFENLAPWANTMTGIACMDFPAFLKEIRRTPPEPLDDCDHIRLHYGASIAPVPAFERPTLKFEAGTFKIGAAIYSGQVYLEEGWVMSAMLTEAGREKYHGAPDVGLSFSPISEWKHLPIIIEKHGSLEDETASSINFEFLGTEVSLTRDDHPNIEVRRNKEMVFGHTIKIRAPSPTFFEALVRGFLWEVGFHYSPAQRDDVADSIKEQVDLIDNPSGEEADPVEPDLAEFKVETARMEAALEASLEMGLEALDPKPLGEKS